MIALLIVAVAWLLGAGAVSIALGRAIRIRDRHPH